MKASRYIPDAAGTRSQVRQRPFLTVQYALIPSPAGSGEEPDQLRLSQHCGIANPLAMDILTVSFLAMPWQD